MSAEVAGSAPGDPARVVSGTASASLADRVLTLGTVSVAATVFTAMVGLYILIVAFGNITDFDTNQAFVQHVFRMDTTFNDDDLMWRSIDSEALQNIAYVGIIVAEALAAVVLIWATVLWISAHRSGSFERARRAATVGFLLMVLIFGLGFITIGGEWFAMWQSDTWNGLTPALQNVTLASFGLVLTHLVPRTRDDVPVG